MIVKAHLTYQDRQYEIQREFPDDLDHEAIEYLFTDGNFACDCNLSLFIREQCDPTFEELDCGGCLIDVIHIEIPQKGRDRVSK